MRHVTLRWRKRYYGNVMVMASILVYAIVHMVVNVSPAQIE